MCYDVANGLLKKLDVDLREVVAEQAQSFKYGYLVSFHQRRGDTHSYGTVQSVINCGCRPAGFLTSCHLFISPPLLISSSSRPQDPVKLIQVAQRAARPSSIPTTAEAEKEFEQLAKIAQGKHVHGPGCGHIEHSGHTHDSNGACMV